MSAVHGDHRSDIRATSPALIGYWSVGYGVGWSGNWDEGSAYTGDNDFWGVDSDTPAYPLTGLAAARYSGFVNDGSNTGSNLGAGNYKLKSDAAASTLSPQNYLMPLDIEKAWRGGFDPPGAYASASPRKGAGFFGQ